MNSQLRRLGKYELRERLASGGQGEVWKAFDLHLHRFVAIKQINAYLQNDSDSIARFEREARFIASLRHPNIVQIHDFFQLADSPGSNTSTAYMVMDYIEGPTLAEYIRNTSRQGQFPSASDIVSIFTAVSLALDYAHQKGMVHRDIKPANIMLDRRRPHGSLVGEPILMDFGIAKLQGGSDETTRALGTPLYTSPERAQGLSGDKRSDLYSLGIILYEIMTGLPPFHGGAPVAILMRHCQDTPTPPDLINQQISPKLSAVILKSIAKDPDARFSSASAMTRALAEALNVPVPPELGGRPVSLTLAPTLPSDIASPLAFVPPAGDKQNPAGNTFGDRSTVASSAGINNSLFRSVIGLYQKRSVHIGSIVILLAILCLVVAYALFPPNKGPAQAVAPVGQLVFLSSQGQGGSVDEVKIVSSRIPDGQNYYAWLETHNEDNIMPVTWHFTIQHGSISQPSPNSDPSLLAPKPYLFLITSQTESSVVPSPLLPNRLYYADLAHLDNNHLTFNILPCPQSDSNNICLS